MSARFESEHSPSQLVAPGCLFKTGFLEFGCPSKLWLFMKSLSFLKIYFSCTGFTDNFKSMVAKVQHIRFDRKCVKEDEEKG